MLVILDVYKKEMLEFPEVVNKFENIVVIDHHVKNMTIQYHTLFEYIAPDLSSVNEIMVDYLKEKQEKDLEFEKEKVKLMLSL